MTAPTRAVRAAVYGRDGHACVSCHTADGLTFQHRRAVGMGGSKVVPPPVDGLILCLPCNEACEGVLQRRALVWGHKVRRWADPTLVPVYYPHEWAWFLLTGVTRVEITSEAAVDAMCAVYGNEYLEWWMEAIL